MKWPFIKLFANVMLYPKSINSYQLSKKN